MAGVIDSQQIFPKRIGIYKGSLVLQYYNLARDVFKKHLMEYDSSQSVQQIVQNLIRNPKHSVYLTKVSPQVLKSVISGKRVNFSPANANNYSRQNSSSNPYSSFSKNTSNSYAEYPSNSYTNSYTNQQPSQSINFQRKNKKQVQQSESQLEKSKVSQKSIKSYKDNFQDSHGYSMKFDEESLNISVVPNKDADAQHVVEEDIDYYDEQFQELSAEKVQPPPKPVVIEKPKKQEEKPQKQKSKDKKKKKVEVDDFEFLDDDQQQVKKDKKEKKKRDKSKQKETKIKSQKAIPEPPKKVEIKLQKPIEDDFEFI